jgi:hypothetical protein
MAIQIDISDTPLKPIEEIFALQLFASRLAVDHSPNG